MSPKSLQTYLDQLRDSGDLLTVDRQVDPRHELSAVAKIVEPAGAPGVYFPTVRGHAMPVATALFGTRERIARSLEVPVEQTLDHVLAVINRPGETEAVDGQGAPVQETVHTGHDASLSRLPIGIHSAHDAGRYLTSAVTIVRDPATGNINTGIYRLMVHDDQHLTVNAAPNHDLGRILRSASGADVQIAIVIGHHPAYLVASQLKNPMAVDAHRIAGALLGQPLRTVTGTTVDLPVPADAEIIVEGVVHTGEIVTEGPFGEFTYYYGKAKAPLCEVTAITHRRNAVFHDLHPTHAEHRCLWLFPGREARLLAAVRAAVPGTVTVRIPFMGGALSGYLSITKAHDSDGQQAILAAFAADHFLKHVIVVDTDVNVMNDQEVLWALNVRFQADRDLIRLSEAKGIRMDPSATIRTAGEVPQASTAKLGFDATMPLTSPFPPRADEPVPDFEQYEFADWFCASDSSRLTARLATRRALAE